MVEFVAGVFILLYIFNKERRKLFTQKENLSLVLPALSLPHHIICIPTPSYYLCSLWNSTVTAVCEICSSWIWWLHCSAVLWTEIQLQVRHSLYVVCVPFSRRMAPVAVSSVMKQLIICRLCSRDVRIFRVYIRTLCTCPDWAIMVGWACSKTIIHLSVKNEPS